MATTVTFYDIELMGIDKIIQLIVFKKTITHIMDGRQLMSQLMSNHILRSP